MPALQITTSRCESWDSRALAVDLIEANEARSQAWKVTETDGYCVLHCEIKASAAVVLRPVKMMVEGVWAASWWIISMPRPEVPGGGQRAWVAEPGCGGANLLSPISLCPRGLGHLSLD